MENFGFKNQSSVSNKVFGSPPCADITFNGVVVTTGFVGASFSVPFGHDYDYSASHDDYFLTEGTISCFYQTETYNIIMGLGSSDVLEINNEEVNIFPNPSSDGMFNIDNIENNTHLVVFDISGKAVYQAQIVNTRKALIDLSCLTTGVYKVQIMNKGKQTIKSIIIE